jgi:hypothetical protein
VPRARASEATAARLRMALGDPGVVARYRGKIAVVDSYDCLFWTGAIAARGHSRFWISDDTGQRDFVVIAHRFGYGLVHGFDALMDVEVVAHCCDNPLCQQPRHWRESTHAENKREWDARRHQLSGPLRDLRGARGAASSTIRARSTSRAGAPLARARRCSSRRSASDTTTVRT